MAGSGVNSFIKNTAVIVGVLGCIGVGTVATMSVIKMTGAALQAADNMKMLQAAIGMTGVTILAAVVFKLVDASIKRKELKRREGIPIQIVSEYPKGFKGGLRRYRVTQETGELHSFMARSGLTESEIKRHNQAHIDWLSHNRNVRPASSSAIVWADYENK